MKEVEIKLYGKVQGVGMRRRILQLATDEGRDVVGYVMNTDTGSVEVLAQGNQDELEEFVMALKEGTVYSQIDDVKVIWHDQSQDSFTDFEIW